MTEIDQVTEKLIHHSAHFLGVGETEFVAEAVRAYLAQRREEVLHAMVDSVRLLDDELGASVTTVAGQSVQVQEVAAQAAGRNPAEVAPAPVADAAQQAQQAAGGMETAEAHQQTAVAHQEYNGQDAWFPRG